MCEQFANSAFSVDQSGSFYNPIPKSKLKTFEHMTSKTNLKCKSEEIISGHINPELVFRRALVLANCRDDVTIENVLSHPIGPIPVSLFHDDGTMRKSCKSDLVKQFESDVSSVLSLPDFDRSVTTYIRDAMAVVQCTDVKKYKTFGDLAADYYRNLVRCFTFANTVADIFDRYDIKNSIKSAERERRSKVSVSSNVFQVIEGRTIPDWKNFFLFKKTNRRSSIFSAPISCKLLELTLLCNLGIRCMLLAFLETQRLSMFFSEQMVTDCPELRSIQEEADTRMILQALHADKKLKEMEKKGRITIKTSDTDVIVLCVHYFPQMTNTTKLWVQIGNASSVKDGRRFFPIHL